MVEGVERVALVDVELEAVVVRRVNVVTAIARPPFIEHCLCATLT